MNKKIKLRTISGNGLSRTASTKPLNGDKERDWSYEYVMDEGIHHVFRACPGGWIQTYTDAQLTGKRIQEVGDDE